MYSKTRAWRVLECNLVRHSGVHDEPVRPVGGGYVRELDGTEGLACSAPRFLFRADEHRGDLGAGDVVMRAEGAVLVSGDHSVGEGQGDGAVVPRAGVNIGEAGDRIARECVEVRQHHADFGAGDRVVRPECGRARVAAHECPGRCVVDGAAVRMVRRHIGERQRNADHPVGRKVVEDLRNFAASCGAVGREGEAARAGDERDFGALIRLYGNHYGGLVGDYDGEVGVDDGEAFGDGQLCRGYRTSAGYGYCLGADGLQGK